jgi:hypothetical protein
MDDLQRFTVIPVRPELVPDRAVVLEIPVDHGCKIMVLYLTPHDAIDKLVEERGLRTVEILP